MFSLKFWKYFLRRFAYLLERNTGFGREKEKLFHPLAHCLKWLQWLGLSQSEGRRQALLGNPHEYTHILYCIVRKVFWRHKREKGMRLSHAGSATKVV